LLPSFFGGVAPSSTAISPLQNVWHVQRPHWSITRRRGARGRRRRLRFPVAYFGTAAFAVRLLRLDQKRRMANPLNTKPELLREFCRHLAKPSDETVTCTRIAGRLKIRCFESLSQPPNLIAVDELAMNLPPAAVNVFSGCFGGEVGLIWYRDGIFWYRVLFFATPTHEPFTGQFSSDIAAPLGQTPFAVVNQLLCLFLGSAVVWTIQWDDLLEMAANRMRSSAPVFACVRGQCRSEFSNNIV
jgi:hypothetical protein